jgi:hypothetical protein
LEQPSLQQELQQPSYDALEQPSLQLALQQPSYALEQLFSQQP